jgi:N-acylneuraminate cytidylyltransferase
MKIIAIIPARGGSKGLPRKNILPLNNKPLISYVINAALNSRYLKGVYVSTEDKEIAAISKAYGAKVIKRPAKLSSDTASSESALIHAAKQIDCTHILFLQCTCPLTTTEDINQMIVNYLKEGADTMFTVTEPECRFLWDEDGNPVGHTLPRKRRQDLKPVYRETGAMYLMSKEGLLKYKDRFHGKMHIYKMPKDRSYDIDTKPGLEFVEKLMRCGL